MLRSFVNVGIIPHPAIHSRLQTKLDHLLQSIDDRDHSLLWNLLIPLNYAKSNDVCIVYTYIKKCMTIDQLYEDYQTLPMDRFIFISIYNDELILFCYNNLVQITNAHLKKKDKSPAYFRGNTETGPFSASTTRVAINHQRF